MILYWATFYVNPWEHSLQVKGFLKANPKSCFLNPGQVSTFDWQYPLQVDRSLSFSTTRKEGPYYSFIPIELFDFAIHATCGPYAYLLILISSTIIILKGAHPVSLAGFHLQSCFSPARNRISCRYLLNGTKLVPTSSSWSCSISLVGESSESIIIYKQETQSPVATACQWSRTVSRTMVWIIIISHITYEGMILENSRRFILR
jgi:hypothetical protein